MTIGEGSTAALSLNTDGWLFAGARIMETAEDIQREGTGCGAYTEKTFLKGLLSNCGNKVCKIELRLFAIDESEKKIFTDGKIEFANLQGRGAEEIADQVFSKDTRNKIVDNKKEYKDENTE